MAKLAKGYTCRKCKTEHKYPSYVYAHWDEVLDHTCECGAVHSIYQGSASMRKKKAATTTES